MGCGVRGGVVDPELTEKLLENMEKNRPLINPLLAHPIVGSY